MHAQVGDAFPEQVGTTLDAVVTTLSLTAFDGEALHWLRAVGSAGHVLEVLLSSLFVACTHFVLLSGLIGIFGNAAQRARELRAERPPTPAELHTSAPSGLEARLAKVELQQAEMLQLLRMMVPASGAAEC